MLFFGKYMGVKAGIRIGVVACWGERANCCGIAIAACRRLIDIAIQHCLIRQATTTG